MAVLNRSGVKGFSPKGGLFATLSQLTARSLAVCVGSPIPPISRSGADSLAIIAGRDVLPPNELAAHDGVRATQE